MAAHTRHALETATQRLKLKVRPKSYSVKIATRPAVRLAYRRNLGSGTWSVIFDGTITAFAVADDFEEANPEAGILDYFAAREKALALAKGREEGDGGPLTVGEAIDRYADDLAVRGGDTRNASRLKHNVPKGLKIKAVALLIARDLRKWRDDLAKEVSASTVNRTARAMKAALNLAASLDPAITNRKEWTTGLAAIPDAEEARNVILPDDAVRRIVKAAHGQGPEFGAFVEVLAVTGARPSQAARLTVDDLRSDRLMMPPSRKGKTGKKRTDKKPLPIGAALAARLRALAGGRPGDALLLAQRDGTSWNAAYAQEFRDAVKAAGLDASVTAYALRHSSIVRQLLAGIPVRVVASNHDTSTLQIERSYSKFITDHTDALTRRALLALEPPEGDNVRPLRA